MLRAEEAVCAELAASSLNDVALAVAGKAPAGFAGEVPAWLGARARPRVWCQGEELMSS
jgi:hypothetical protein